MDARLKKDRKSPVFWRIGLLIFLAACCAGGWHYSNRSPAALAAADAVAEPSTYADETRVETLELAAQPLEVRNPDVFSVPGAMSKLKQADSPVLRVVPDAMDMFGQPDLAMRYAALAVAARDGSVEAALRLGSGLAACSIQQHIVARMESRIFPGRHFDSATDRDQELARVEREIQAPAFVARERNCAGITEAQSRESADWFLLAAQGGDSLAAHNYVAAMAGRLSELATDIPSLMRFRSRASTLMHRDASQCVGTAFYWLSSAYANGTFEARDPVRAAAYGALSNWAAQNTQPATSSLTPRGISLSPLQIRQAQDLANRIYRAYCAG